MSGCAEPAGIVLDEQTHPLDPKPVGHRQATTLQRLHGHLSSGVLLTLLRALLPFPSFPQRPGSHSAVCMQVACPGWEDPSPADFSGSHPRWAPNRHRWELKSLLLVAKMLPVSHQKAGALGCLAVNCIVLLYFGTSLELTK